MTADLVLAIDQGTTNTKACLVDRAGRVVASSSVPVPVSFPQPGWVESDGRALWTTVERAIDGCLARVPGSAGRIAAVGVANQRESVLVWDRATGAPVGPLVSWQCRRSAQLCERLRSEGAEALVASRTGLTLDPMFSASKARWLLDQVPDGARRADRGELCIGTVDTWLAWNLTGGAGFVTDATNASRTLLLDLDHVAWDHDLLALFGIPVAALPAIRGSASIVGETRALGALPAGVPIGAIIGDSHGALVGHGFPGPGAVKATFGTGTSVMAPLAAPTRDRRLSATVAWSTELPSDHGAITVVPALEGNITATGAAIAWVAAIVGRAGREEELDALAASVPDAGGAYLVPAFTGLGAPHWDPDARGLLCGITRGTGPAHLARAAFEAVAYQVRDVLEVLGSVVATPMRALFADGGAMRSDLLARITADVTGLPVVRDRAESLAAMGAAYLAGLAVGTWSSLDEVRGLDRVHDRVEADTSVRSTAAGYAGWQVALQRASGRLVA
jgi:glycerol kinase